MAHVSVAVLLLFSAISQSAALNATQWQRRTIYQVITDRFALGEGAQDTCDYNPDNCLWGSYCGGSLWGVIDKLDYIQGMGFDAIYISPIVENVPCGYHGFWAKDLWKVNSHFGGEKALLALTAECHKRGMAVMLDTVFNHMGPPFFLDGKPREMTQIVEAFTPFNNSEHYHDTYRHHCEAQGKHTQHERETCWMGYMEGIVPDLAQENQFVADQLVAWTKHAKEIFGIDGFRADAVPYVNKTFWKRIKQEALSDSYIVGEVVISNMMINNAASYQATIESVYDGMHCDASDQACLDVLDYTRQAILADGVTGNILDGVLLKEMLVWIRKVLHTPDGHTYDQYFNNFVGQYQYVHKTLPDVGSCAMFIDSHDDSRFLHGSEDWNTYKNAITMTLFLPGVPIALYGMEQGMVGPGGFGTNASRAPMWREGYNTNHPLYGFTSRLVRARQAALAALPDDRLGESPKFATYPPWYKSTMMSWQRGSSLVVVSQATSEIDCACIQTELAPGKCMYDALAEVTDNTFCVMDQGLLQVPSDALPHVFFEKSEGCHVCASATASCSCGSKKEAAPPELLIM